jgi:hypothetical protein
MTLLAHPSSIKHPKGIASLGVELGPISNRDLGRVQQDEVANHAKSYPVFPVTNEKWS